MATTDGAKIAREYLAKAGFPLSRCEWRSKQAYILVGTGVTSVALAKREGDIDNMKRNLDRVLDAWKRELKDRGIKPAPKRKASQVDIEEAIAEAKS